MKLDFYRIFGDFRKILTLLIVAAFKRPFSLRLIPANDFDS